MPWQQWPNQSGAAKRYNSWGNWSAQATKAWGRPQNRQDQQILSDKNMASLVARIAKYNGASPDGGVKAAEGTAGPIKTQSEGKSPQPLIANLQGKWSPSRGLVWSASNLIGAGAKSVYVAAASG